MTVRDRLREAPLSGEEEAAGRAWPVVEAALAERAEHGAPARGPLARTPLGLRGPRRAALRLALVAALLAAGLVVALTPAGAEMGDWIEDRFAAREEPARPAFAALPDGGSVLAISSGGAYAVHPDGSTRRLGPFSDAGWSPRGLHVVGVNGRRLVAVTPTGTRKWTLVRPRTVHHPAWSLGDGFVVAYLEGRVLKAVAGNGDPATDRVLRRGAAAVAPAWRRDVRHVLTYVTTERALETLDADSGTTVWRTRLATRSVRALAWSRNGRRLVALSSRGVTVLDRSGRLLRTLALPGVARHLALHPSGERAAVVIARGGRTRVVELRLDGDRASRVLFQGNVDGLAWSQDGRHLLLSWRDTGEWLLVGPRGRMRALHDVAGELGAAEGFPRVAGWCCAR